MTFTQMPLAFAVSDVGGPTEKTPRGTLNAHQANPVASGKRGKMPRPSIEQRFADFHAANPHVMVEMLRLARLRLARGATRIGAKDLYEELRRSLFTINFEIAGCTYKLDNSLCSLYARALLDAEPALVGVIEVRRRRGER
jgi:hypothetical protein